MIVNTTNDEIYKEGDTFYINIVDAIILQFKVITEDSNLEIINSELIIPKRLFKEMIDSGELLELSSMFTPYIKLFLPLKNKRVEELTDEFITKAIKENNEIINKYHLFLTLNYIIGKYIQNYGENKTKYLYGFFNNDYSSSDKFNILEAYLDTKNLEITRYQGIPNVYLIGGSYISKNLEKLTYYRTDFNTSKYSAATDKIDNVKIVNRFENHFNCCGLRYMNFDNFIDDSGELGIKRKALVIRRLIMLGQLQHYRSVIFTIPDRNKEAIINELIFQDSNIERINSNLLIRKIR